MQGERSARRLATTIRQIKDMLSVEESKGLFETLLQCLVSASGAHRAFVLFSETNRPSIRAAHGIDRLTTRSDEFRRIRQIADHVLTTGELFLTGSLDRDSRFRNDASPIDPDLSIALLPMRASERVVGVVYLDRALNSAEPLAVEDIGPMQDIVDIAGIAVEARFRVRQLRVNRDELRLANVNLERMASSLQEDVAAKSVELMRFERDLDVKNRALRSTYTFRNIVGRSAQMHRVFDILNQVMDYPVPVLITGESGTGKELIARALHHGGARADEPFMAINCAAIPENLLESELFGYKRGAFTGATSAKEGLFISARKGTVFLDELGEMPMSLQAKLLRVLQENEVRPIGGRDAEAVEARIIGATNRDLKAEVRAGRFREDLYYRLNVVEVRVPPLRERVEDIPALADHFLRKLSDDIGMPLKRLDDRALQRLMQAAWPGNVRQLENAIKSSALLSRRQVIGVDQLHLPDMVEHEPPRPSAQPTMPMMSTRSSALASRVAGPGASSVDSEGAHRSVRNRAEWEAHERERILEALFRCQWNKTRAARVLGISRRNLYRKLERYGIEGTSTASDDA